MEAILTMLFFVLSLGLLMGAGGMFVHAIFQPILSEARGRHGSWRVSLSDVLCLFFVMALPLSFVAAVVRQARTNATAGIVVGMILVGFFVYLWWRGAGMLSAVGITHVGKRSLFLAVLLPIVVIGGAIGVPALLMFTIAIFFAPPDELAGIVGLVWLLGLMTAILVTWGSRRGMRWVMSEPRSPNIPPLFAGQTAPNPMNDPPTSPLDP